MLTISILAQKGGSGKTTVGRCLAVAFELDGVTTALLDLDPQASAALWGKRREAETPEVISTVLPLLDDALEAAAESVDVVLIDTPPKSAEVAIAAARVADLVIVPCRPQIDDIETLPGTRQVLDVVGGVKNFVLLNSVTPYESRNKEAIASIENHPTAPFSVCPHMLGQRAAFGDSSILGMTPQEYEPKGKASEEISRVYKFVCEQLSK